MLKRLFASKKRPCFRNLGSCEAQIFDISGCKLEVNLPPHDYEFPEQSNGDSFNIFSSELFSHEDDDTQRARESSSQGVSYPGIFLRKWDTFGSLFRPNPIGLLKCSLVVSDISKMDDKLDCFNERHMEYLLMDNLYHAHGPGFGYEERTAPVNWKVMTLDGVRWVYLESWAKQAQWEKNKRRSDETDFSCWLATPIFRDKYLLFAFTSLGSLPSVASNQLMLDRINKIIFSVKLRLSNHASQQKQEAEKNYPTERYSELRDPEPWQYYGSWREGDLMAGEKEIVFEGECSPPPRFS